jgi:type I restriction enzyme R subunit
MDEVKLRLHKTSKKYTSLKDELERVIENYHKNAIDSYTTIAELIERAKLLKKKTINKELGLSDEELAFYDILASRRISSRKQAPSGYCTRSSQSS